MRQLPNFVGGFIRSNKVSFLVELVRIQIRSELEHLKNLEVRRPTEKTLFEDFLEIKQFEESESLHTNKTHVEGVEGLIQANEELSIFVDIALSLYRQELLQSLHQLRGLKRLERFLRHDLPAAVAMLEEEIAVLKNMRESFDSSGVGRVLNTHGGDGRQSLSSKPFDDEIAFLSMIRSLIVDVASVESKDFVS
jgi:hypothetical protein